MLNLIIYILTFLIVPKNVILHLEKIPDGITHTGISFQTPFITKRYDFRAFNENNTCMTTGLDRQDPKIIFPNIYNEGFDPKTKEYLEKFFDQKPKIIKIDVNLGTTLKTFDEIEMYSNKINNKYIFCIYDCRHYTDKMAVWAGVGHIPIWRLNQFFKEKKTQLIIND
tara:strand:+ start:1119 stop:1622 length:504 start_codon:yes stop_codon:yes gene_type:complete